MRSVSELTGGKVRMGPGTLYGSVKTLLEGGLIQEVGERAVSEMGSERRRYYRLTLTGRRLARSEAERLAAMVRLAQAKRFLKGAHV
jgi:DNA-binding PadR family transcriptional regulator